MLREDNTINDCRIIKNENFIKTFQIKAGQWIRQREQNFPLEHGLLLVVEPTFAFMENKPFNIITIHAWIMHKLYNTVSCLIELKDCKTENEVINLLISTNSNVEYKIKAIYCSKVQMVQLYCTTHLDSELMSRIKEMNFNNEMEKRLLLITREDNPVRVYCIIESVKKGKIERIYFELIDSSNIRMIYDIDLDKYTKAIKEKEIKKNWSKEKATKPLYKRINDKIKKLFKVDKYNKIALEEDD